MKARRKGNTLATLAMMLPIVAITMASRRTACEPRLVEWGTPSGITDVFLHPLPPRTTTATTSTRDVSGPLRSGWWHGDDHSRLVLFDIDINQPRFDPLRFFPLNITPTAAWREFPYPRLGNTGVDLVSGGLLPRGIGDVGSVRSTDIGYCSVPLPWTVPDGPGKGAGIADQIATKLIQEIRQTLSDSSTAAGRYYTVFRVFGRSGESVDDLCIRVGPFARLTSVCEVREVYAAFCGHLRMVPDVAVPGARNVDFVLTSSQATVGSVSTGCSGIGIGVSRSSVREGIIRALEGKVPGALTDAFDDCMWQRENPNVLGGLSLQGCRIDNLTASRFDDQCDRQLPDQEAADAVCAMRFPGVRSRCERRGDDSRPVCYWNIEAERFEMLPSRLELVLSESDPRVSGVTDETIAIFNHVLAGTDLFEDGACRRSPPNEGPYLQGEIDWLPTAFPLVLDPVEPPAP